MTEFIRLPERFDAATVDVPSLVERIGARQVVLDWNDVGEVDAETCRALFAPFEGRYEEFGDALGIWSMPERIQPDIDWAMGIGPEPERRHRAAAGARPAGAPTQPVRLTSPCGVPEMDLETPAGVRAALHRLVELDLLGPACGPEEELLKDAPKTRYVVGTLAPKNDEFDPLVVDDSLDGAGEEGVSEGVPEGPGTEPVSRTLFASSIGLTFVVSRTVEALHVRASWGSYRRVQSEVHFSDDGAPRMVWKRVPRGGSFELRLDPGRIPPVPPDPEVPEVRVKGAVRDSAGDDTVLVTLFLVNDQVVAKDEQLKDRRWVFQPEIEVNAIGRQPRPSSSGGTDLRTTIPMAPIWRRRSARFCQWFTAAGPSSPSDMVSESTRHRRVIRGPMNRDGSARPPSGRRCCPGMTCP